jgi:hypothetical protein
LQRIELVALGCQYFSTLFLIPLHTAANWP